MKKIFTVITVLGFFALLVGTNTATVNANINPDDNIVYSGDTTVTKTCCDKGKAHKCTGQHATHNCQGQKAAKHNCCAQKAVKHNCGNKNATHNCTGQKVHKGCCKHKKQTEPEGEAK